MPRRSSAPRRHDIFVSYSHAQVGLARELKRSLEAFGKTWRQRRARSVFLDEASIPVGAPLEESVVRALHECSAFLLIASPAAGSSTWVGREVDMWLAEHGSRNFLIVLAEGELRWDPGARRFDPVVSTALPRSAHACFTDEPLWEDVRNLDPEAERDRLTSVSAGVVAGISGKRKDEVYSADIRQHRRAQRIAMTIALVMTLLVVGLLAVSLEAIHQRRVAQASREVASAHAMAASSTVLLGSRLSAGLVLAMTAHQVHDDVSTRSALFDALSYDPHLERFFRTSDFIHGVTWDGDSGRFLVWSSSDVQIAGASRGQLLDVPVRGSPTAVVASRGAGSVVAIGNSAGEIQLSDATTRAAEWRVSVFDSPVACLDVSFDAHRIAAVSLSGEVALLSRSDGRVVVRRTVPELRGHGQATALAFAPGGAVLVVASRGGATQVLSTRTLTRRPASVPAASGQVVGTHQTLLTTRTGVVSIYLQHRTVRTRVIIGSGPGSAGGYPTPVPPHAGALTVSGDGSWAAVGSSGQVTVIRAMRPGGDRSRPIQLAGAASVGSVLSLSPDGQLLASAFGRTVGIWRVGGFAGVARSLVGSSSARHEDPGLQTVLADPGSGTAIVLTPGSARPPHGPLPGSSLSCWRYSGTSSPARSIVRPPPGAGALTALAWNRRHTAVLVATSDPTAVWSIGLHDGCPTGAGSAVARLSTAAPAIEAVAPLADSTIVVLLSDGTVQRLSSSGAVTAVDLQLPAQQSHATTLAASADGRQLLLGFDHGLVQEYRLVAGRLEHVWDQNASGNRVQSVAFVNSHLVAASKGAGNVVLIDRTDGTLRVRLGGAQGFALSPAANGSMLVGAGPGYRAAIWDVASGQLMASFTFADTDRSSTSHVAGHVSERASVVQDSAGYLWFSAVGTDVVAWDFDANRWDGLACAALATCAARASG